MVLLIFLFDYALPWLALRQGIRCNDSDIQDMMWAIAMPWFRVSGKTNYAPMAVDVPTKLHRHQSAAIAPFKICAVATSRPKLCGSGGRAQWRTWSWV